MTSVSTIAVGANMAAAGGAKARHGMTEAIARLSTGVRSMYGGDAGGASQAFQVRAEGRSAFMAARNAEDGISYLQTAESLLLEIANMNTRLRELAVQKLSTGTTSDGDVAAIEAEEDAIVLAANDIDAHQLNGENLLAGIIVAKDYDGTLSTLGASSALTLAKTVASVDAQFIKIAKNLGLVAAGLQALKGHQAAMYSMGANAEAAASRIQDTDFARESASLAKNAILNQSAMAMVAQANQAQSAVMAVLQ
jgi:flagellin